LLLLGIAQLGTNQTVLRQETFTYGNCLPRPGRCLVSLNAVRLQTVDNSWGGALTYTYAAYRPSANNSICNNHCPRYAVTSTDMQDGLGNSTHMAYYYGPTNQRNGEWSAIDNTGEFLGFRRSEATTYAVNDPATVVKWDAVDTWQGQRDRPDPRRGRTQRQEVRAADGTTLALTVNDWQAYRRVSGDWDSQATTVNSHVENHQLIYDTLWVRLESASEWTAGAGKWTKNFYERSHQNNQQFGNLTRVEEWSHAEASLLLGKTDGSEVGTWNYRLKTGQQLALLRTIVTDYFPNFPTAAAPNLPYIVNQPARVQIADGNGHCLAETRTIYDNLEGNYNSAPTTGLVAKTQHALTGCGDTLAPAHDIYNTAWAKDWAETRMAYDVYGNLHIAHHVGTNTANDDHIFTNYDRVYHLFPIEQYSGQNQAFKETASYYGVNGPALSTPNAVWGAVAEYCAVNQICTRQSYDEWGRRLFRWDIISAGSPWGSNAEASVRWDYRNPLVNPGFKTTAITEWHAPRCAGNFMRKH